MFELVALWFCLPVLLLSVAITLVRLIIGPDLANRVVALDLMASIGIAIIAAYAMASDNAVLLDIALVSALLAFLGTVAFGYFLENHGHAENQEDVI